MAHLFLGSTFPRKFYIFLNLPTPGLSGAATEARDRLVDASLQTNKQTKIFKGVTQN